MPIPLFPFPFPFPFTPSNLGLQSDNSVSEYICREYFSIGISHLLRNTQSLDLKTQ